jgi:hypothetical protein
MAGDSEAEGGSDIGGEAPPGGPTASPDSGDVFGPTGEKDIPTYGEFDAYSPGGWSTPGIGPSMAGSDTGDTKADPGQDDTISDTSVSGLGKGLGGAPTGPLGTPEADIAAAIGAAQSAVAADEAALDELFIEKYGQLKPRTVELEAQKPEFQRSKTIERAEHLISKREASFPNPLQSLLEDISMNPVRYAANAALSILSLGVSNVALSAVSQANTLASLAGKGTVGSMVASAVGEDEIGGIKGNIVGGASFGGDSPSTSTQSASVASSAPGPAPGPDSGLDGGPDGADFQSQRSAASLNRAASNNTTLAIGEEDDRLSSRQIRAGRLRATRFA